MRARKDCIEFPEEAVEAVYHRTDGNPFFTNAILAEVFDTCVNRKDAYVTPLEVERGAARAIQKLSSKDFQHFWGDGILGQVAYVQEVSIRRRRILLALQRACNGAGRSPPISWHSTQPSSR